MIAVVDASVAVKWFLLEKPDEDHAMQAMRLLEQAASGDIQLRQPPHFIAEMAAVLARLKPEGAQQDLLDLLQIEQEAAADADADIYVTALDLAMRHQHHLFDTLYHAVALHTPGAQLITADKRYYDKTRREGRICLLADWGAKVSARAGTRHPNP